jgi:hypothetical protein
MICTRCQILVGQLIKEDEMGKECGMLKKEEKFTRYWWGKHLENPCVDARMI